MNAAARNLAPSLVPTDDELDLVLRDADAFDALVARHRAESDSMERWARLLEEIAD